MLDKYYFGQGKVSSRPFGTTGRGGWRWWGDVGKLTLGAESDKVRHEESYSGQKGLARSFVKKNTLTLAGTLSQIDSVSLAELLNGTVTTVAGGTVVAEPLGTLAVGDLIKLDYPGVSSLVITDSAGTPVTIPNSHFDLELDYGAFEVLSLPTSPAPTAPLKAGYTYSGYKQVAFLTRVPSMIQLRYEGINLAEDGAPVICEFYRVGTDVLKELALISDGNDTASTDFSADVLIDGTKPSSGTLGRFGRFIEVS